MANTVIQLKFSTATATPTSLNVAEPAYSYTSNTLFIGSPAGTGSIAIGGKFFIDQQANIFNLVNSAFTAANTAGASGAAYAFNHANAAFDSANSAATLQSGINATQNTNITNAQNTGDAAFLSGNTAATLQSGINTTQNNSITAAFLAANSVTTLSAAVDETQNNSIAAAFLAGNTAATLQAAINTTQNTNITNAQNTGDAAFTTANNALPKAGGTITGDLVVTGNLTTSGTRTYANTTNVQLGDNIITLNAEIPSGLAPTENAGIEVNRGSAANVSLVWNEANDNWTATNDGSYFYVLADAAVDATQNASITSVTNTATAAFLAANSAATLSAATDATQNNSIAAAFTKANNSLDTTTGGSITGNINVSGNVYAGNIIANSAFVSSGGGSRLQLSDIGIASIQVGATEFKFQASGIESSPGIFGGAFGGNKLSLNNETILVSNRFDIVKIQTGEDGTVKNEFSFANNAFIAPGEITSGSVVAGGINVVPTLVASFSTANAAFAQANTDYTGISTTAANYGNAAYVSAFKVEANGRISSANSTAIAIGAGAITSGTLSVERGGTGVGTHTVNGVLLGQGTGALQTASSSTEGHVLTINNSGVPTFSHLQGGTF